MKLKAAALLVLSFIALTTGKSSTCCETYEIKSHTECFSISPHRICGTKLSTLDEMLA